MNRDFEFFNPTQVFFGRSAMENLAPSAVDVWRERASGLWRWFHPKNGVYDQVMAVLKACGKKVTEFTGIMPNPTYAKVLEGGALARGLFGRPDFGGWRGLCHRLCQGGFHRCSGGWGPLDQVLAGKAAA